jgi:hypothetical protein
MELVDCFPFFNLSVPECRNDGVLIHHVGTQAVSGILREWRAWGGILIIGHPKGRIVLEGQFKQRGKGEFCDEGI